MLLLLLLYCRSCRHCLASGLHVSDTLRASLAVLVPKELAKPRLQASWE